MNRARVKVNEPPVLFNRGPSATTRFIFFSLLSLAATITDYRFNYLADIRQAVSTALYPLEQTIASPVNFLRTAGRYLENQKELIQENTALQIRLVEQSASAQRAEALDAEYSHLRHLADTPDRLNTKGVIAEIIRVSRNPFNHKLIVNRGSNHEIKPGQPVIDDKGVVGQVTSVTPFSSEITLITDKGQAIPIMLVRNGLRAVAFGNGHNTQLSIPFLPVNADIQKGDRLVTSGIDGTYPPGLMVASVLDVQHRATLTFSQIAAMPLAAIENHRYLMILTTHSAPANNYPKSSASESDANPQSSNGRQKTKAKTD